MFPKEHNSKLCYIIWYSENIDLRTKMRWGAYVKIQYKSAILGIKVNSLHVYVVLRTVSQWNCFWTVSFWPIRYLIIKVGLFYIFITKAINVYQLPQKN